MNNSKAVNPFCYLFGHNYLHVNTINSETSQLVCKSCNSVFISKNNGVISLAENQNLILTPIALPAKSK